MAKLTLDDIGSTLTNTAATTINNNNNKIEQALENTLSRNGLTPNNMQADIDMDGNDLLNVSVIDAEQLFINGERVVPSDAVNTGEFATAAQGAKADSALQPNTGVYRIPAFTSASSPAIPLTADVVYVETYDNVDNLGGAFYKAVASEPTHSMKFLNAGRWFEIAEEEIDIKQAGAVGGTEITSAWNAALSVGKPVKISKTSTPYLCDVGNLNIPSNSFIYGDGYPSIQIGSSTLNPLITTTGDDITVEGVEFIGNSATQQSASSGSAAFIFTSSDRPIVRDCKMRDWTRHGILFEGCLDPTADYNEIENVWRGAGILFGSTLNCTGLSRAVGNRIKNVRQAHIQGYVAPQRLLIEGNQLDNNDYGAVGVDISDNITFYDTAGMLSAIILGNTCTASVNNGIHMGGDMVIIQDNVIINPVAAGIACAKKENVLPNASNTLIVSGNVVVYTSAPTSTSRGIIVRDYTGGSITGNTIKNANAGIEIAGLGATPLADTLTVTGNTLVGCTNFGMWYRRNLRNVLVTGNVITGNAGSNAHRFDVNSINTVTITNGGSGYTTATVTFSGGGASGSGIATATVTLTAGVVTAINITNYGFGYTSVPTLVFAGDGINAAATATLFVVGQNDLRVFGNHETGFISLSNHVRLVQSQLFTPKLSFEGSTANLDAWIVPQGTGRLRIGTMVAATTPANFTATHIWEVKQDDGTLYRIPCRTAAW